MSVFICAYECTSAAGQGVSQLWEKLKAGVPCSTINQNSDVRLDPGSTKDWIAGELDFCWSSLAKLFTTKTRKKRRVGIIYASTKGHIEDHVWAPDPQQILRSDSLCEILDGFIARHKLTAHATIGISNACSSSHVALHVGRNWIEQDIVDEVIILSADRVGPFIAQGFKSLRALSQGLARPFSQDRDGLNLGSAAAIIWISNTDHARENQQLLASATLTEGFAATRPEASGQSLIDVGNKVLKNIETPIDLIVAHGTGTLANDKIEDHVFSELFPNLPPVTGSKWCIGHSMGASGAIDTIIACETIRRGEVFSIATHNRIDSTFRSHYLIGSSDGSSSHEPLQPSTVFVSSLGFGGVQAAVVIGKKTSAPRPKTFGVQKRKFKMKVKNFLRELIFDPNEHPVWAQSLERWHQLDESARLTAILAEEFRTEFAKAPPDAIVFASRSASNLTDVTFASTGACSPSKFVHTLPSVRANTMLQLLGWRGPVYCVQHGNYTLASALKFASGFCEQGLESRIWVISINPEDFSSPRRYRNYLAIINFGFDFTIQEDASHEYHDDDTLLAWVKNQELKEAVLPTLSSISTDEGQIVGTHN